MATLTMTPAQHQEYVRLQITTPARLAYVQAALSTAPELTPDRLDRVVSILQTSAREVSRG